MKTAKILSLPSLLPFILIPISPLLGQEKEYIDISIEEGPTEITLRDENLSQYRSIDLSYVENLTTLNINNVSPDLIPEELWLAPKLNVVSYTYDSLSIFPEAFANAKNIRDLYISTEQEELIFPNGYSGLNMRRVKIMSSAMKTIPETIFTFTNLTSLEILSDGLLEISTSIGNLQKLEFLGIESYSKLEELPPSFYTLRTLKELSLTTVGDLNLSESFCNLTGLEVLYLNGGRISLPKSFGNLSKLRNITISYPTPRMWDFDGVLLHLKKVKLWGLFIPFSKMPNATDISILAVQIPNEHIAGIAQLRLVEKFELSGCQLTSIPSSINGLTKLKRLILQGNDIREVPVYLNDLPSLQSLHLYGNPISGEEIDLDNYKFKISFSELW